MNNIIKKKINKNKNLNTKAKKKKSQIFKNKEKKIKLFFKKNIINKYTNFFFKYKKKKKFIIINKKIKNKKIKKKSKNYKNFKTKIISFYNTIKNNKKKKTYVGNINHIYKYSKPIYQFDFNTTFFAPIKHIVWYERTFIEFFNKEKTFNTKPKLFNKIIDKEFRKFGIRNTISWGFDKKINKIYNIKKIYANFLNENSKLTEIKLFPFVKSLPWKERAKFGRKLKKKNFDNFIWNIFLKLSSNKKFKKNKKKKNYNLKKYKNKNFFVSLKTKKINRIKFFKFVNKKYKLRFSIKWLDEFLKNYPKQIPVKQVYDSIHKKKFNFFITFSNENKNINKIFFHKTKQYKLYQNKYWKFINFTQTNFFKQKIERNLESYLTFIEKKNIQKKNIKINYSYKKRMNKKKNRKKIKNWYKKKNWIIGFHSKNCFRKRRFKNNSIDQEKKFIIRHLLYKHKYTIKFSKKHRIKANKVKIYSLNNVNWNSFEWLRLIKFIQKKFKKRKKKKITKIKFKKKKIFTVRDAKINLSKGKISYAKATKKISGIKIKIKAFWIKLRYRKIFIKNFYRWTWYINFINNNNQITKFKS